MCELFDLYFLCLKYNISINILIYNENIENLFHFLVLLHNGGFFTIKQFSLVFC